MQPGKTRAAAALPPRVRSLSLGHTYPRVSPDGVQKNIPSPDERRGQAGLELLGDCWGQRTLLTPKGAEAQDGLRAQLRKVELLLLT